MLHLLACACASRLALTGPRSLAPAVPPASPRSSAAVLFGPLLMLSASLVSVAIGLPLWVLPAPLLAAFGLALFYETRAFRDYSVFLVGTMASGGRPAASALPPPSSAPEPCPRGPAQAPPHLPCPSSSPAPRVPLHPTLLPCPSVAWFLWHHFSFLEVSMDGVPLRTLCALLLGAALPGLALPGLVQAGAPRGVVGLMLVGQVRPRPMGGGGGGGARPRSWLPPGRPKLPCRAWALRALGAPRSSCTQRECPWERSAPERGAPAWPAQAVLLGWLEEHLYAGDHEDVTHGLHPMYPPYLVAATSGERARPSGHLTACCGMLW
jgi:hypothetical protein